MYALKTSRSHRRLLMVICILFLSQTYLHAQNEPDSVRRTSRYKNVLRYNLSGAMLFGLNRYFVFGYERIVKPNQSFSVNGGKVSFPKLIAISTDSFNLQKDTRNTGYHFSIDYRFYLPNENKHAPPHGLYIGPYYSFNHYTRNNRWTYKTSSADNAVSTDMDLTINTVGFQLGYQFVLWRRLTLDFLMFGPGVGFYNLRTKVESNLDAEAKEDLYNGLEQLIQQKFPGMNYVFSGQEIKANGVMRANAMGYRYIIHIGFAF